MGGWMDGWVDGWMGGWMDGWMDGWVDGWMDGWIDRLTAGWLIFGVLGTGNKVTTSIDSGRDPFSQKIRKFRFKVKWKGNFPTLEVVLFFRSERNVGNFLTICFNFPFPGPFKDLRAVLVDSSIWHLIINAGLVCSPRQQWKICWVIHVTVNRTKVRKLSFLSFV